MRIVLHRKRRLKGQQYHFVLQSHGNFKTVATSEKYLRRSDMMDTIALFPSDWPVIDQT